MTDEITAVVEISSFYAGPFGGGVALGETGEAPFKKGVRARIPAHVLSRTPISGEVWRITGAMKQYPIFDHHQQKEILVEHILATWASPLVPGGSAIRNWIAKHPNIRGVGKAYAERLWDAYGSNLYHLLRQRDVNALAKVLDYRKAVAIVDAFGLLTDEITAFEELDSLGLDSRTARAAMRLYGTGAGTRFRENPYLLTLLEPWKKVDAAALASGLLPSDERRLLAAVDTAIAAAFRTSGHNFGGHTVVSREYLSKYLVALLQASVRNASEVAIDLAIERGILVVVGEDRYQGRASWHMERQIEEAIAARLSYPRSPINKAIVEVVVSDIEREGGFKISPEQRDAVHLALSSGVAAINGGAGTGKSTIVKAIMRSAQRLSNGDYVQIALSGRAAKRLREATGYEALTIYRYLKEVESGRIEVQRGLLVIDECSMVSTPDLWQILAATPTAVDVLLVGDPGQLPPLKAGNPTAAILASKTVPRVTLSVPFRQSETSGIPQIAHEIREGRPPIFREIDLRSTVERGVEILSCDSKDVPTNVEKVFEILTGYSPPATSDRHAVERIHKADVQILTMTKNGPAGSIEIGNAIEQKWMLAQQTIYDWGFRVGSKILWTKNSYEHDVGMGRDGETVDVMNGALGIVRRQTSAGAEVLFDDDTFVEILRADLDRVLRGWAITTHKAQGSAFRKVIIPVVRSRLLDRAMLYTAVTRARHHAVLVGDPDVIHEAIVRVPNVWHRQQALNFDFEGVAKFGPHF